MENQTTVITSFVLMGFTLDPILKVCLFLVFLFIYAVTLIGNTIIMILTRTNRQLDTPMYFFLSHLAFLDICFSSVTVPKLLANIFANPMISKTGCFVQMFLLFSIATTESFILTAMAYDRYAAICNPLHYIQIMDKIFCRRLIGGAWTISFFHAMLNTLPLINIVFCGSNIRHFSCELTSLLTLSCTESFLNNIILVITGSLMAAFTFFIILASYIHIVSAILKMHSSEARRKTLSTCSSHLIVLFLYYSAGCFRYMRPNTASSVIVDELVSIQYSITTPMLNPIIYSLTNREIKEATKKLMRLK